MSDKFFEVGGKKYKCVLDGSGEIKLVLVTAEEDCNQPSKFSDSQATHVQKEGNANANEPKKRKCGSQGSQRSANNKSVDKGNELQPSNDDGEVEISSDSNDNESESESENENDGNKQNRQQMTVKGKKRERVSWNKEEICAFIKLCHLKHINAKLDGQCGRLRQSSIFKNLATALNEKKLGKCAKDGTSCRRKYKSLRISYFKCLKSNGKSGNSRHIVDNMDELALLFANRPRKTLLEHGFESSEASGPKTESSESTSTDPGAEGAVGDNATPSKRTPPKYRSGAVKNNPLLSFMNDYLTASEKAAEKHREWVEKRLEAQEQREVQLMTTFASTINSGLQSIAQMFMQQPYSAAANFSVPSAQNFSPPPMRASFSPQFLIPNPSCNTAGFMQLVRKDSPATPSASGISTQSVRGTSVPPTKHSSPAYAKNSSPSISKPPQPQSSTTFTTQPQSLPHHARKITVQIPGTSTGTASNQKIKISNPTGKLIQVNKGSDGRVHFVRAINPTPSNSPTS